MFFGEVDQVGQVQTSRKSMKKGSWPTLLTLPTFFRRVGGSRRFDATLRISDTTERRLGMESGALEDRERPNVFGEVDQVGQVQTSRKSMKKGSWPTLLTLPTFFRRVGGPRRLDATLRNSSTTERRLGMESGAFEDRERPNVFGEVDQVGQVQTSQKPMKKGSWPTLPTLPTFFRRVGGPRRLDATLRNSDATESRLGLES